MKNLPNGQTQNGTDHVRYKMSNVKPYTYTSMVACRTWKHI